MDKRRARAVERTQFLGLLALVAISITMRVLVKTTNVPAWELIAVGISAMIFVVSAGALIVSRIEHVRVREVLRRSNRGIADNVRRTVQRLRRFRRS